MRLLLGFALLLGLGYGGVQVMSQLQRPPQLAAGLAPVPVSSDAARSFDDKVKKLEAAASDAMRTGKSTPVEVTFTEQELTSKLAATNVSFGGIATTNTQVHFSGGNVIATSTVKLQGFDMSLGVVATPVVEAGQARLVVQDIQTGGIPLPDALKQQLSAQLGQAIDPRALGVPFDVTAVRIVDGRVVISGTARP